MSKKSKKKRDAPPPVGELIAARLVQEQQWAWERRIVDALPWPLIRSLALRPREHGGIGRHVGIDTLKGLVAAHRAAQGEIVGTREERIERRQFEYDTLALAARSSIARAAQAGALDVHGAKVLLEARSAESKMHGDDAALKIEADVTTHDAVTDELNAMLARAGRDPIKIAEQ